MIKVLIAGDVHWSQYSSIWRSRNKLHSSRLDNLIYSVNWIEEQAVYNSCSAIIYMGDFFDSNHLNAEEISALQYIRWAPTSHVFITGNHETNVSSLEYSTADLFKLCPDARVISTPEQYFIDGTDCEFCFLPYILERDRQPLHAYFGNQSTKRIIFSHNDLKDVNYGNFVSPEGFEVQDIHDSCDLFMNGHIHHYSQVTDKIINTGNITGQNFTENEQYKHGVFVLDTSSLKIDFIENPYAVNFRKLDCTKVNTKEQFLHKLDSLPASVLTIRVNEDFAPLAKAILKEVVRPNILEYRVIVDHNQRSEYNIENTLEQIDHRKQFKEYILLTMGDTELIQGELAAVLS